MQAGNGIRRLLAVLLAVAAWPSAAQEASSAAFSGGHLLVLHRTQERLVADWRPVQPGAPSPARIELRADGKPVARLEGAALAAALPQSASLLYLADVSRAGSHAALREAAADHAALAASLGRAHVDAALMAYDDRVGLLLPALSDPMLAAAELRAQRATNGAPNIWGALAAAIGYMSVQPESRKSIVLVSDGTSTVEAGERDAALIEHAQRSAISITALTCPGPDSTRPGLERLARLVQETGGAAHVLEALGCALDPREALEQLEAQLAGGRVAVPIRAGQEGARYEMFVEFADGTRGITSLSEPPTPAKRSMWTPALAALLAALLAAGGGWLAWRRRLTRASNNRAAGQSVG